MAPSYKLTPNTWKRLAISVNHARITSKHLRKSSSKKLSEYKNEMSKLNLQEKFMNLLIHHKWIRVNSTASPSTPPTSVAINKKTEPIYNTEQQQPNSSLQVAPPINSTAITTTDVRQDVWIHRLSRQLSGITFSVLNQIKQTSKASPAVSIKSTTAETAEHKVKPSVAVISRAALESRAQYVMKSIALTKPSNMSRHMQVQELCRLIKQFPRIQCFLTKAGAHRQLLLMKSSTRDPYVLEDVEEGLALLGHCRPPLGWGLRILSIDGGGLRGMIALEVLRELENSTGQKIHQLFDYICGVSTGSVLAILLGPLKCSISRCEQLYKEMGEKIFQQNTIWGTGKLVLSHAYYDTAQWTQLLRETMGEVRLIETARDMTCPKISSVSAVVSSTRLEPYLFRNYEYSPGAVSCYRGSHHALLWEAARASAAAPGYFEEFKFDDDIHQDGGILVNNPTAVAIHECRQLWPRESLQCVISLGNGRYEPQETLSKPQSPDYTGLKKKIMKIIDSATDTEAVHTVLHDLLPTTVYFRMNPYLSENISLDETRPEKMAQLQEDARMYIRRNQTKLNLAASTLTQSRTKIQQVTDIVNLKKLTYFS